ncbi:hypothetical protein QWZ14_07285 [Paeniroseomonas aquatica]|uniref:HNH endonuclease n=1 Tax=Paeniroseomonas aquatica TaxID=373043 RepID=A0ABT8A342_9PROT|nr:hypothetical protein [Paeniroseomonas aquatica]MDN3564175.1 hypothetical protein [Paeniroseomonas aquatica]
MTRLLPLNFAVHSSAWVAAFDGAGQSTTEPVQEAGACRFCDDPRPVAPAPLPLDGDHGNRQAANLATACLHCRTLHRLGSDQIDQEATLIWLPDISQPALNWLVRSIHRSFLAHGEPPCLANRPTCDTPRLRAAYRTYAALDRLSHDAEWRIGTTSPRELGAALLSLPESRRVVPAGLRLLHQGRHYVAGRDLYPALLEAASELPA